MNTKDDATDAHYAVIFIAELSGDLEGYEETAAHMRDLAARQDGFLGIESVMEGRREITVSYWKSPACIRAWKRQPEHREAQRHGRDRWYRRYSVQVTRIERRYLHDAQPEPTPE